CSAREVQARFVKRRRIDSASAMSLTPDGLGNPAKDNRITLSSALGEIRRNESVADAGLCYKRARPPAQLHTRAAKGMPTNTQVRRRLPLPHFLLARRDTASAQVSVGVVWPVSGTGGA